MSEVSVKSSPTLLGSYCQHTYPWLPWRPQLPMMTRNCWHIGLSSRFWASLNSGLRQSYIWFHFIGFWRLFSYSTLPYPKLAVLEWSTKKLLLHWLTDIFWETLARLKRTKLEPLLTKLQDPDQRLQVLLSIRKLFIHIYSEIGLSFFSLFSVCLRTYDYICYQSLFTDTKYVRSFWSGLCSIKACVLFIVLHFPAYFNEDSKNRISRRARKQLRIFCDVSIIF